MIPRLIPLVADEVSHFQLARRVDLFKFFNEKTERTDAAVASQVCRRPSDNIISARKSTLEYIKKLKQELKEKNDRLKSMLPEGAAAQRIDIALLDFLISHTGAPDRELSTALIHGMPLSGEIPQAASLHNKEPKTRSTIEDVLRDVQTTNKKIIRNLQKQSQEDRQLCYDMTIQEISDGKVSTFRKLTNNEIKEKILTPRFLSIKTNPE